jgi:hypothetical protein
VTGASGTAGVTGSSGCGTTATVERTAGVTIEMMFIRRGSTRMVSAQPSREAIVGAARRSFSPATGATIKSELDSEGEGTGFGFRAKPWRGRSRYVGRFARQEGVVTPLADRPAQTDRVR